MSDRNLAPFSIGVLLVIFILFSAVLLGSLFGTGADALASEQVTATPVGTPIEAIDLVGRWSFYSPSGALHFACLKWNLCSPGSVVEFYADGTLYIYKYYDPANGSPIVEKTRTGSWTVYHGIVTIDYNDGIHESHDVRLNPDTDNLVAHAKDVSRTTYMKRETTSPTPTPTSTKVSITDTPTATFTATPSPSRTPTAVATMTFTPTSRPFTGVALPLILFQPTPTPKPTATSTFTPTPTFTPIPTRVPLFVGLEVRWDGKGFIRFDRDYDVGTHYTRVSQGTTDPDTVKFYNRDWYDPNPLGWPLEEWHDYYSTSTGRFKASSEPSEPEWMWGSYWILPYDVVLANDQTVLVGGQEFKVTGPLSGYTSFGRAVLYWKLVNKNKFLFRHDDEWPQYVHAGDITLHYDAVTRLRLVRDVLRRVYRDGKATSYTVQYISYLTESNAYGIPLHAPSIKATDAAARLDESVIASEIPLDLLMPEP